MLGTGPAGLGIRRQRYSTDINVNTQTMNDIRGTNSPHPLGEVWASILWDMYWSFIDVYGYDFTWEDVNSGNFMAVQLVMDGMRLQPCGPGFIEGRDAILAADNLNFDGAHQCMIWNAFARRGVGYDANGGEARNRNDNIEGYQTLPSCLKTVKLEKTAPPTANADDIITITVLLSNHTDNQLENAVLTNTIPPNAEYVLGSSSLPITIGGDQNTVIIPLGQIPSQMEMTITYDIKVGTESASSRVVFDDFGPGNDFFRNINSTGAENEWRATNLVKNLGANSYNIIDDTLATGGSLTQTVSILLDQDFPAFSFWHRYITEYGFDGGILEISEDGGNTWNYIPDEMFLVNGYTVEMILNFFDFTETPKAFTGNSGGWVQSYVDLSFYKGKEVLIRFRWESDANTGVNGLLSGWFIDYVEYHDLKDIFGASCLFSENQDEVCSFARTVLKNKEASTSLNEITKAEFNILVYPNPTAAELKISFVLENKAKVNISINDLNGRLISIISGEYHIGQNDVEINTTNIPDGIYVVHIDLGGNMYNQKFVKLKK